MTKLAERGESEPEEEEAEFVDLFAPLRSNLAAGLGAEMANQPPEPTQRTSDRELYVALCLIGAVLGVVSGLFLGSALYTPDPNAFMDLGGIAWGFYGALIGLLVGAIGLPLAVSWFRRRHAHRVQHQP